MTETTSEHQGHELLHGIEVLTRCLQLPRTNPARRRQWQARIRKAKVEMEALYAAGLDRAFRIRHEGHDAGGMPASQR